jgi:hypothetical protein
MRRLLVAAGVLICAVAAIAAAQARSPASVRFVRSQPLTVSGSAFGSLERVRLRLVVRTGTLTRRVVATRAGGFSVSFGAVPASRCGMVLVAVGNRGSRPELKRPPLPACMPA